MGDLENYKVKFSHKEVIEAEEILLDSQKIKKEERLDYELGRMELPIKRRNFVIFLGLILAGFLMLIIKIAAIQIGDYGFYSTQAKENAIRIYPIKPQRGVIYDRNFKQLVFNQPSFNLVLDKNKLKDKEAILREISEVIKIPNEELLKNIEESAGPQIIIAENLDHDAILTFEIRLKTITGVKIEKDFQRDYVVGVYFSNIMGFLRRVSPDDLNNLIGYYFNDFIGKGGLEQSYESILRGVPGKRLIERDVVGEARREEILSLPQDGQNILLHLDFGLQKKLYDALSRMAGKKAASAIALDPRSGGILAMVSLPSFDNNIFSQKISQEEFEKLDLLNRPIAGIYPSGSIIKPISAAAALSEGLISPDKKINCPGEIKFGNKIFKDWKAHGLTGMIKAIAQSCNVYFYTIGGGYGKQEGLGLERIVKYLKLFGWGTITGIDLLGEQKGVLPEKLEYPGDIYSISIGQGEIAVTPLQVALSYSAIANGGTLFKPFLVDKIIDKDKNIIEDISPEIIRQNFIDGQNLEIVRKGMREAVVSGSVRLLNSLPVKVAGKTGTAQFGKEGLKTHAWFSGFAPYDNPEIVLTIIVEGGGEGSETAVPVAKEVFEYYFSNKKE